MAVYPLEPYLLAVQPKRLVVRGELAYAEPRGDGAKRACRDGHAVEVGTIWAPELERRHREARAPIGEANCLRRATVERDGRFERSGKSPFRLKREFDCASLVVARPHHHAVELHLRMLELELHAVVEAAREEEVIVRLEHEVPRAAEPVVERDDKNVLARHEGPERNLEFGIGKLRHRDFAAVDEELCLKPHALHDEPRVLRSFAERERAAVVREAALGVPLRHQVEAPRNDHLVGRLEVARRGGEPTPRREHEVPGSVERNAFEFGTRREQGAEQGGADHNLFHVVIIHPPILKSQASRSFPKEQSAISKTGMDFRFFSPSGY